MAFGTSVPEALPAMQAVDQEFKQAFPGQPVVWAYTSQIIRKKIAAQGRPVGGISDGLAKLAKDGVKVVRVQSLHVMAGEEFSALERAVLIDLQKNPGRFEAVYLGRPMLESEADAQALASAILEDTKALRGKNAALVLMGHGQEHGRAGLTFEGVRALFHNQDKHVFMATVEGERSFDDLLKELKAAKVKSVVIAPLMLVAGDHARNDLAGDEADSWASQLKAAGFKVTANLKGLGQVPGRPRPAGAARQKRLRRPDQGTQKAVTNPFCTLQKLSPALRQGKVFARKDVRGRGRFLVKKSPPPQSIRPMPAAAAARQTCLPAKDGREGSASAVPGAGRDVAATGLPRPPRFRRG